MKSSIQLPPPFNSQETLLLMASKLSVRELSVIQLIAQGLSSKEITVQLRISGETVKKHRKNVLQKLGCSGKNALQRLVCQLAITTPVFAGIAQPAQAIPPHYPQRTP